MAQFRKRKRRKKREIRKTCRISEDGILYIDVFDTELMAKFVTEQGKILPRRITGTSPKWQKKLAKTIKRSRNMGLMQ
ncbi:MAG: 30S ribosomal protein S18 [Lentisphaeria bacterium]|nr:30S ribosomal protein S18 [Lentisphaeria bacterium]NQZ67047.1 30S ribosomal protein S18 [Lentisphaeria bacterium]